jgi:hypothetical protein
MAVKTVILTLNGQDYTLTYDSSEKAYKKQFNAPSVTSFNENTDHQFHPTVVATDEAGNSTTATISEFSTLGLRVKEKDAPTISVTYPAANAFIATSKPTIKWTVKDTGSGIDTSTIGIKIDSGSVVTSGITTTAVTGGYSCEYTPTAALAEGSHTLTFSVSDNDGNAATAATVTFKIDTVPPTANVSAPVDGLVTNNRSVAFNFNTNDATSSPVTATYQVDSNSAVEVTVDSSGNGSGTIELPNTEGSHTIKFVFTDSAGKSTTVTRTVTLDTVAPVISEITFTPNPVDAGATLIITVKVSD